MDAGKAVAAAAALGGAAALGALVAWRRSRGTEFAEETKVRDDVSEASDGGSPELVRTHRSFGIGTETGGSGGSRAEQTMALGLLNLGNTCFMNAVLQALAAVPPVLHWFRKVKGIGKLRASDKGSGTVEKLQAGQALFTEKVVEALELLSSLHSPEFSSPALSPNSVLDKFASTFKGRNQQDAQEFLTVLMNIIDTEEWGPVWRSRRAGLEVLLSSRTAAVGDGRVVQAPNAASLTDLWQGKQPLLDSAEFLNPMLGWFAQSICCTTCTHATPWRNEPFLSLSVQVQPTIEESLRRYVQYDHIGDYRCERSECGAKGAVRRARITRLPHVLCLHVQRLQVGMHGMEKVGGWVKFPLVLDMAEYVRMGRDAMGQSSSRRRRPAPAPASGAQMEAGPGAGAGSPGTPARVEPSPAHARAVKGVEAGAPDGSTPQLRGGSPVTSESGGPASTRDAVPPGVPAGGARAKRATRMAARGANPYGQRSSTSSYTLMAVVQHLGGAGSGHYVTLRRAPRHYRGDDAAADSGSPCSWIKVSDDVVRPASLAEVLDSQAYMLFYVRRDQAGLSAGRPDHPFWYNEQHVDTEVEMLRALAQHRAR